MNYESSEARDHNVAKSLKYSVLTDLVYQSDRTLLYWEIQRALTCAKQHIVTGQRNVSKDWQPPSKRGGEVL